ncbi:oocyte zinc finger protein XlCOF28-like [Phlebotomus argentipes]|uniref:oocyte zinc finger protein XlCOF28-like n=1 Tax=Phlebotomus argentipes TaxID=94469 RepID=UPI002892D6BF|nr:oocyte zinc finger protein XlCOF28-like [Phlebotomus argentipes]
METTITLNTDICRICEESKNYLINLYEESNAHLFEKLKEIENVAETDENVAYDNMFRYICTSCENTIEGFYEFKIQCQNTRSKLMNAATCGVFGQPQPTFIILDEASQPAEKDVVVDETASESSVELIEDNDAIEIDGEEVSPEATNPSNFPLKIVSVVSQEFTITEVPNPKSVLCTICNKKVAAKTFDMHKARHEQKKIFECSECCKTFTSKRFWIAHLKDHISVRENQCDQFDKAFMVAGQAQNHKITHSEEKGYVCPICEKGYNRYHNLKGHVQKVHGKTISMVGNAQ